MIEAVNRFIVAALQCCSTNSVNHNLQQLAASCATLPLDVDLLVLPENFALMGGKGSEQSVAEQKGSGPIQAEVARLAN